MNTLHKIKRTMVVIGMIIQFTDSLKIHTPDNVATSRPVF